MRYFINDKTATIKALLIAPKGKNWRELSKKEHDLFVKVVNKYSEIRKGL